jgi:hypothetical protein
MVELSLTTTKQSLRKNELIFEVFKLFFFHDIILYFSEGSQKIMVQISNHKPININNDSSFFLIRAAMPRLRARTQPLKQSYNIGKSTTPVFQGRETEQPCQHRWKDESTNHHCRRRSSQDKYCKDNPPRGNQEKQSKTDQAKQDLEDRT